MKTILLCISMIYGSQHGATLRDGPLHRAARDGNVAEVQRLLDEGAVPDAGNFETPLLCAARAGHTDIVAMLLSRGADPYIRDYFGLSSIEVAMNSDNQEFMETFFTLTSPLKSDHDTVRLIWMHSAGIGLQSKPTKLFFWGQVDPNIQDKKGETALHKAAAWNDLEFIALLILLGVNLNIQNSSGNTPLHLAASCGHEVACAALLNEGARHDIKNIDGATALDVALKNGYKERVRRVRYDCRSLQPLIDASMKKVKDELRLTMPKI